MITDKDYLSELKILNEQCSYHELSIELNARFPDMPDLDESCDQEFVGHIGTFFIDCGTMLGNPQDISKGIHVFHQNRESLEKCYSAAQLDYNLGNAYHSLYQLERKKQQRHLESCASENMRLAKSYYWRAYSGMEGMPLDFRTKELNNLASMLLSACRVVEALDVLMTARRINPEFPFINATLGQALIELNIVSSVFSVTQLKRAAKSYRIALTSDGAYLEARQEWDGKYEYILDRLEKETGSRTTNEADHIQTILESLAHSDYRQYCLRTQLSLSEHSLYCHCIAAGGDDLDVADRALSSNVLLARRMVHYFKRVKSEYGVARALFYRVTEGGEDLLSDLEELGGREPSSTKDSNGTESEILRLVLRMCFGILDKIARGVCELFDDHVSEKEDIYFTSFWKKNASRWDKIKLIENPGVMALYSQATDISRAAEWSFLKDWRDKLEHELLFIYTDPSEYIDEWHDHSSPIAVSKDEFRKNTLHALRFVRASVFYFAWSVRYQQRSETDKPQ